VRRGVACNAREAGKRASFQRIEDEDEFEDEDD
jgi:hypothetical protein